MPKADNAPEVAPIAVPDSLPWEAKDADFLDYSGNHQTGAILTNEHNGLIAELHGSEADQDYIAHACNEYPNLRSRLDAAVAALQVFESMELPCYCPRITVSKDTCREIHRSGCLWGMRSNALAAIKDGGSDV